MTPRHAEDIALRALTWLCMDDELLRVFLAASGAGPDDLRAALGAPEGPDAGMLGAALEFILMRDATVIACARALGLPNDRLALAGAVLSGRAGMHWT
ncbi:MAG: DUF3572 domain-containing protein [Rhodobacteraceae bacterium]|nr:DUF3572 domain-containing protein [Paracoccaceae bacterium]